MSSTTCTFKNDAVAGRLSIVIPVYNDPEGLQQTFDHLAPVIEGQDVEILVANDGAMQNISDVCQNSALPVRAIPLPVNQGPGGARNEAITHSSGEWLAFLDADVMPVATWLTALRDAAKDADFLAGDVELPPNQTGLFQQYEDLVAFDIENYVKRHHTVTANLAVRRTVIEQIGYFDARFRSGEDTEFGHRVYDAGFKQAFVPDMLVLHPPRTAKQQYRKTFRVCLGHEQLAASFPDRFSYFKMTNKGMIKLAIPPRKVCRAGRKITKYGLFKAPIFYTLKWAQRLFMVGAYLKLHRSDLATVKHDLSA